MIKKLLATLCQMSFWICKFLDRQGYENQRNS